MELKDMTEAEQVLAFKIEDELIANRTMDETNAKAYAVVCLERALAYREKLATMQVPLYLKVWAVEMAALKSKALIKVHHNYLPWLDGFLVTRYGEAVEHWPTELTEMDIRRAREWKVKGLPNVVVA